MLIKEDQHRIAIQPLLISSLHTPQCLARLTWTSRAKEAARSNPSLTSSPNSPPPWILRYRVFASQASLSAFTPWAYRVDSSGFRWIKTS